MKKHVFFRASFRLNARRLRQRLEFSPRLGIVLGSGFDGVREVIRDPLIIAYDDITGFLCGESPTIGGVIVR